MKTLSGSFIMTAILYLLWVLLDIKGYEKNIVYTVIVLSIFALGFFLGLYYKTIDRNIEKVE